MWGWLRSGFGDEKINKNEIRHKNMVKTQNRSKYIFGLIASSGSIVNLSKQAICLFLLYEFRYLIPKQVGLFKSEESSLRD